MPSALRRHNLYLREMVRDIVLELVGRALYAVGAAFGYVGVDHGGFEVSVASPPRSPPLVTPGSRHCSPKDST